MKSRIFKSIALIIALFGSSIIYNACCETDPIIFNYNKVEFSKSADSSSFVISELSIWFEKSYAQNTKSSSLFITSTYADAISFCEPVVSKIGDPIADVKLYNVLDFKKDITNLFRPSSTFNNQDTLDVATFIKTINNSPHKITFKTPYPEEGNYQILIEVSLESGTILSDTLNIVYFYN